MLLFFLILNYIIKFKSLILYTIIYNIIYIKYNTFKKFIIKHIYYFCKIKKIVYFLFYYK